MRVVTVIGMDRNQERCLGELNIDAQVLERQREQVREGLTQFYRDLGMEVYAIRVACGCEMDL